VHDLSVQESLETQPNVLCVCLNAKFSASDISGKKAAGPDKTSPGKYNE